MDSSISKRASIKSFGTLDNSTSAVQFRDMLLNAFGAAVSPQMQADAAANVLQRRAIK